MKIAAFSLVIAALAVGSAAAVHASSSVSSVPQCPKYAPKFNATMGQSKAAFVRPNAQVMRLCRYYKNNWANGQTLWRMRLIDQSSTLVGLTHAFNRLQEPPRGIFCIRDDGSEMQLIFGYADGSVERVVVKLSGCRFTSNGKVVRSTTQWLHKKLLSLANSM